MSFDRGQRDTHSSSSASPSSSPAAKSAEQAPGRTTLVDSIDAAGSSPGQALPDGLRDKFEGSLGADLSGVRVHTGEPSAKAASAVSAKAYAIGDDIHFGAGQYDPGSHGGEHLLAHEVAHTVQQSGGAPHAQHKLEVSSPGDTLEVEADRAADAMVTGGAAQVSSGSGVARKVMREAAPAQTGAPAPEGSEGGEAKAPGAAAVRGASTKGTWHLPEIKLGESKLGMFDLEAAYTVDVNFEAETEGSAAGPAVAPTPTAPSEPANSYNQQNGKAPASVSVGTSSGPDGPGVQAELSKELAGGFTNFKPSIKGGAEITGKNLKVDVGIEYESKWGPVTFGTAPVNFALVKWEAGKAPEFAVASASLSAAIPFKEWEWHGVKYKIESEGELELSAKPDLVEMGKYVAEHAAEMLSAEFLLTAGLIAGGILSIAVPLYQIAKSEEFTQRTEPEVRKCRAYCMAYHQAMRGEPMSGGDGAAEGYAAGKARLDEIAGKVAQPDGAIAANAKNHDFYSDAWAKAWPQVKDRMIESYWDEHYFEKFASGGEGYGNGGFKTFKMLLDGWDRG